VARKRPPCTDKPVGTGPAKHARRRIQRSELFIGHEIRSENQRRCRLVCEELGVDPKKIDILMGTLSKSFASCGGYLAGSSPFIQSLRYSLSGFIFATGMTPANTAAALEAIRVMGDEPERLIRLRQNARYFLARATEMEFNCGTAAGVPVVPTIFGDSATTLAVANLMFENGVSVNPIIFPAVAESLTRLRFFITSEHTPGIIDETLSILQRAVRSTGNLAA